MILKGHIAEVSKNHFAEKMRLQMEQNDEKLYGEINVQ